jgi:hypothetical protein
MPFDIHFGITLQLPENPGNLPRREDHRRKVGIRQSVRHTDAIYYEYRLSISTRLV